MKVLAFGNPVYDDIRTPWVCTIGRVLSGCATNAAFVYRRLGGDVTVVGRVGTRSLRSLSDVSDPITASMKSPTPAPKRAASVSTTMTADGAS